MSWTPWGFTNPFIAYTPILAEEMNPKLNGISASFTYVAEELNTFRPRLPSNFTGNVAIPDGSYSNTLLAIDENGNMTLVDQGAFKAAGDKDFTIIRKQEQQFSVSGANHAEWILCDYVANGEENIEVIVGQAVVDRDNIQVAAPGTTIIFTQASATKLTFAPIEGVTVKTPGILSAYGENSTVTLMALDQHTWVLGGDVLPGEVIVDDESQ